MNAAKDRDFIRSVAHCREVTRRAGSSFALPFRTLPRHKRRAFEVVYAYMRICDDLSDDGTVADRTAVLRGWRDCLRRARAGDVTGHPVMPALAATCDSFAIDWNLLEEIIDGVEMDLSVSRYATWEDLYAYCYRVASVVGLVSVRIFGLKDESPEVRRIAERCAEACGIAFQLTNILRDVREDAERDRVYLPKEDLERFGLSAEDIVAGEGGDRLIALVADLAGRAQDYYDASSELTGLLAPDARPCYATMRGVYHGILERIEAQGHDVWTARARVPLARKLGIAARAVLTRFAP